jgi:peptidoglycan hydrolase CwlO-like protein
MYVKVHTKKSAFQAFAASIEQRFTSLERVNTELQGENQKLQRLVASLGVSNQELRGMVASLVASNQALEDSNRALEDSNRALQGRVDRLERTLAAAEQNAGLYLDVAHFYATDADQGAGDLTNADE